MRARRHWESRHPLIPTRIRSPCALPACRAPARYASRACWSRLAQSSPFERFATATFKPTGTAVGDVGTFDILVEDGRGGSVLASLPITIIASNRPPVTEARRRLRIYTGALGITPPTDPDGDRLTVTVQALPSGLVRFGVTTIRVGDRILPEQLPALTYVPEPGFSGPAGTFQYLVDDGRGGQTVGSLDIEVMDPAEAAAQMAEAALWERLRASGRVEDVDTFLRLYPNSYLAASARRRREELLAQSAASSTPPPAKVQQTAAPQPLPPPPAQSIPKSAAPPSPPAVAEAPKRPDQWLRCNRSCLVQSRRRPRSRSGTSRWLCPPLLLPQPAPKGGSFRIVQPA